MREIETIWLFVMIVAQLSGIIPAMNFQTILRYISIACLFLVPFIGLVMANFAYFPYITGKNIAFRALIDIAAISYGVLILFEMLQSDKEASYGKYLPKWSKLFSAGAIFIGVLSVADLFGENFTRSLWSNFERMEGLVTFIHLALYILLLAALFKKEVLWRRYFQVTIVSSIMLGVRALFLARDTVMVQLIGRTLSPGESIGTILKQVGTEGSQLFYDKLAAYRLEGTLGNSTYVGAYAMLAIFLATYLSLRLLRSLSEEVHTKDKEPHIGYEEYSKTTAWWWLTFYVGSIIFNMYILFHSGTRSAALGLVAALAFASVALAIFERKSKLLRGAAIAVVIAGVLSISALFIAKDTQFVQSSTLLSRYAKVFTTSPFELFQTEGKGRTGVWKVAIEGFKERPILGWGQDNFLFVFGKYYNPNLYDQEQWFDRAHNVFLDWMIAGGTLGIVSYLLIYAAILYLLWKKREREAFSLEEKVALTSLLIGYFVHNLFVFDSITSYIMFAMLIAFISYRDTTARHAHIPLHEQHLIKNPQALHALAPTFLIIGVIYLMYQGVFVSYASSHDLISARQGQFDSELGYQSSYNYFQDILDRGAIGQYETREQLALKAVEVVMSGATLEEKTKWVNAVTSEFTKQLANYTADSRSYIDYAIFLQSIGDFNGAEKNFMLAHQYSPGKQVILYQLGQLYTSYGIGIARQGKAPKSDSDALIKKGMDTLKKAIELAPQNPLAHQVYALAAIQTRQYTLADPELDWMRNIEIKNDAGRIARYESITSEQLLSLYKDNGDINTRGLIWLDDVITLARLYVKDGRGDEAKIVLDKAEKLLAGVGKKKLMQHEKNLD